MFAIRSITTFLCLLFLGSVAAAQKAEVTIGLNEAFFDSLLDSVFQNYDPPQFSIAQAGGFQEETSPVSGIFGFRGPSAVSEPGFCSETVTILRENNGVRTAVRFRDGKVFVPLAFSGGYAPPFIGCIDFAGMAEADVDLEFDAATQRLVGRARVTNVNLNGTGGIGGTVIAKLIQGSIDKKLNPIEILSLDKVSFGLPIPKTGTIKMKATGARPEILNGAVQIRITYEFLKG